MSSYHCRLKGCFIFHTAKVLIKFYLTKKICTSFDLICSKKPLKSQNSCIKQGRFLDVTAPSGIVDTAAGADVAVPFVSFVGGKGGHFAEVEADNLADALLKVQMVHFFRCLRMDFMLFKAHSVREWIMGTSDSPVLVKRSPAARWGFFVKHFEILYAFIALPCGG